MSGHLIGYEQLACEIDKEANFKEHREMGSDLRQFPVNIASRKKKLLAQRGNLTSELNIKNYINKRYFYIDTQE